MKIYEDPPAEPRGVVASLLSFRSPPNRSSRKAVSFAGNTKTPQEYRDGIKTPLQSSRNHQSPGRTPKIQKSPKMSVASFRQSLKTPPLSSRTTSVRGTLNDKENASNREAVYPPSSSKATGSKIMNAPKTAANTHTAEASQPATPTVASALRRTLRATVHPKDHPKNETVTSQVSVTETTAANPQIVSRRSLIEGKRLGCNGARLAKSTTGNTFSKLGPPQRVAPKTPNSLLRTEMEALDSSSSFGMDNDDSLLLSPPPGAVWNALNLSSDQLSSTTGLVVISPQAAATLHDWSSEKKERPSRQSDSIALSDVDDAGVSNADNASPAIPRTLQLKTPPTIQSEDQDKITVNSTRFEEHLMKSELTVNKVGQENVEKASKGGVAMDFSKIFSPQKILVETSPASQKNVTTSTSPSLAASFPPSLLSRLNANRHSAAQIDSSQRMSRSHASKGAFVSTNRTEARKPVNKKKEIKRSARFDEAASKEKIVAPTSNDTTQTKMFTSRQSPLTTTIRNRATQPVEVNLEPKLLSHASETFHKGGLAFDVSFQNKEKASAKLEEKVPSPPLNYTITSSSQSWADKQSDSFGAWLNYTLSPEEEDHLEGATSVSGLRGLLIHRRLAEVRNNARELFSGESMRNSRMILLREISGGRLAIRKDRDVAADVQLRNQLAKLLLSYTTPWLRMALEVMFDEVIEPAAVSSKGPKTYLGRMKVALEAFIKTRFLSDDSTLAKFTKGRCNVPSGVFETRYKAQMRCLVLSRFMILVFFLDLAKSENLLDKVPRLFSVSSEVKSSRDMLVALCRACLSAEGDIVKHLSRIGLKVAYKQDPIDEVNFKVSNLATDLRDGVVLTRLCEILSLTPFKSIMRSLRLPAVSRLQKKFNVSLALSRLLEHGIVLSDAINAHHIMDGHREMVLALMWCIISHCCMTRLLNEYAVEQEIQDVLKSSRARRNVAFLPSNLFTEQSYLVNSSNLGEAPQSSAEDTLKTLLLRWSQAVCASFGKSIENFTTSFADGKALCYLIHYYHPGMLPVNVIHSPRLDKDDNIQLSVSSEDLQWEQSNWLTAIKAIKEIGGVPGMIPCSNSHSPPDEKTMLLCLSYLCSRLMESSKEIFAVILIQGYYRTYQRRVLLERKMIAAKFIFSFWSSHRENYFRAQRCRYAKAVSKLESFVLTHKAALCRLRDMRLERERQNTAATKIQRIFRGLLGREVCFLMWEQHQAAVLIQSVVRRITATRKVDYLLQRQDAAVLLQSFFRGLDARQHYFHVRHRVVTIQRVTRGMLMRNSVAVSEEAATRIQRVWWIYVTRQNEGFASELIQKMWRGRLDRHRFSLLKQNHQAACSIQRMWRGFYQQVSFYILTESTVLIQRVFRGFLSRQATSLHTSHNAAKSIQKIWRGFSQQVRFQMDIMDIICVQSVMRRYISSRQHKAILQAVLIIQCAFRCSIAQRCYNVSRSALKLQSLWRLFNIQTKFRIQRSSTIVIQTAWRRYIVRKNLEREVFAATVLQSCWRRYWVYSDYTMFLMETTASVVIQALVRRNVARSNFLKNLSAAIVLQRSLRIWLEAKRRTNASIVVQTSWRRFYSRGTYLNLRSCLIAVQCSVRMLHAKKRSSDIRRKMAATVIARIWRGFSQQVEFQLEILDIVCAQSSIRRYLAKKHYIALRRGICVIQRSIRCASARKQLKTRKMNRSALLRKAGITIQTFFRAKSVRSRFIVARKATILLQKCWRGHAIRCAMWNLSSSACHIQSNWRRYLARCNYLLLLLDTRSAILIQSCVRMQQTQAMLVNRRNAAVSIQCCFRCFRSKTQLSTLLEHRRAQNERIQAAATIQAVLRGIKARKLVARMHAAAVSIQSYWRCYVAQNDYLLDLLEFRSAIVIQSTFRMYLQRDDFMLNKYASQTIQRCTRGFLSRMHVAVDHFAATEIQRIWRGYSTYSFPSILCAVIKIQSLLRMGYSRKVFEELRILRWAELCYRQRQAASIQRTFRRYQLRKRMHKAAEVIQNTYRFYSQLKRIQLLSRGTILFQSLFRGRQTRKVRSKKMIRLAHRIHQEKVRAIRHPDLRLGNRTDRALRILQTSQSLTKIMDAVKELEASTRLSVVCCQVFTKANAANILLHLIQSCNRSVPHMELKEHILLTLENVSRLPTLVGSFSHYKYAEVFLDNVQVFRDKDGIFCLAVSLLDRISEADSYVAQYCSSHEHLKRLKEVYRVVSRRLDPRKVTSSHVKGGYRQHTLKKRVEFNRDYSIELLGQMIDVFSNLEHSIAPQVGQRFQF